MNIFTTVFQKAVLEEALLCNEQQIEITVLIISSHGAWAVLAITYYLHDDSDYHYTRWDILELPLEQL